jgi:multiple antibiotic resistance protein
MDILSATLLLFLVMDPIGNVTVFISLIGHYDKKKQNRIIVRESLIAMLVLIFFLFAGRYFLSVFGLSEPALTIAGGIILFIIALKLIFQRADMIFESNDEGEPIVVPLAIPYIAGPSSIATVMLMSSREPARWPEWLSAIIIASVISGLILLMSAPLGRLLGNRGLSAVERLVGLLLTAIAVQMLLLGIRQFAASLKV